MQSFIHFFRKTLKFLNENKNRIEFLAVDKFVKSPILACVNEKVSKSPVNLFIECYLYEYQEMIFYCANECLNPDSKITNWGTYRSLKTALALLADDKQYSKLANSKKGGKIQYYELKQATKIMIASRISNLF